MSEEQKEQEEQEEQLWQNIEEECQKILQKIEEVLECIEAPDKYGLDTNAIVASLTEQIAEKKEEIKVLRQLRKRARPNLWHRIFG